MIEMRTDGGSTNAPGALPPETEPPTDEAMPTAVRIGLWSGLALLLAGAAYLLVVRGTALMLDLAQLAGSVLCF